MSIWICFWFVLMDIGKALSIAVVPVCPPINKSMRVPISSHLELHRYYQTFFSLPIRWKPRDTFIFYLFFSKSEVEQFFIFMSLFLRVLLWWIHFICPFSVGLSLELFFSWIYRNFLSFYLHISCKYFPVY